MKNLLIGVVLVVILGGVGFWYRYSKEHAHQDVATPVATSTINGQACTDEAKVCPDGSAVGRTGPNCSFATCVFPNVTLTLASSTVDFVVPTGYQVSPAPAAGAGKDPSLVVSYQKKGTAGSHLLRIYDYIIPPGSTAQNVMLANTILSPLGMPATSTKAFSTALIAGRSFSAITTERFEGQVETAYYLVRPTEVIRFDILEKDVANWTDPKLIVSSLPEHQSLAQMLATLQIETP
jgi:hypothetical protein